jgi:hypothetical protein
MIHQGKWLLFVAVVNAGAAAAFLSTRASGEVRAEVATPVVVLTAADGGQALVQGVDVLAAKDGGALVAEAKDGGALSAEAKDGGALSAEAKDGGALSTAGDGGSSIALALFAAGDGGR